MAITFVKTIDCYNLYLCIICLSVMVLTVGLEEKDTLKGMSILIGKMKAFSAANIFYTSIQA